MPNNPFVLFAETTVASRKQKAPSRQELANYRQ